MGKKLAKGKTVVLTLVLFLAMLMPLSVPNVVAQSDEWLAYKWYMLFDSDGDGYDDSVEIKIAADTDSEEEIGVYAWAFLSGSADQWTPVIQESGIAWSITGGSEEEFVYLYLCAPTNVPARNYGVSISLFDGEGNFEDTWFWPNIFLYPPAPPNLVVRGLDNRICYRTYSGGSWESWHAVPIGATCDAPAAALHGGKLYTVVRGMDGSSLWFGWINLADDSFHGWIMLSGATEVAPTLFCYEASLGLVVKGMDNGIYYRFYDCVLDEWGDWSRIPTGATGDSPAAAMMMGDLHVVVRGMDNGLWHYCSGKWNQMSGATQSAPVLTSNLKCRSPPHSDEFQELYVVVRGLDDGIYRATGYWTWEDKLEWTAWNRLTGATCDAPGSARQPSQQGYSDYYDDEYDCDTRLYFVVRGSDGFTLWHGYVNQDGGFSGWMLLYGSTPSAPRLTP